MAKNISQFIPIGEWLPDQQALDNTGAFVANNVIPDGEDYKPFPSPAVVTNSLGNLCNGAFSFRDNNTNINHFAGTKEKLFKLDADGDDWDDVTNTNGDYTGQDDIFWKFVNFGDRVIATNYTDNMQSFLLASSTHFEDLSVDAPRAKYMTIFKDFVVVANTYDTVDGAVQNRVRWSGLNNPTQWTVGTNGSDFQDIQGYGGIVGMVNVQDFVLIILETAIVRMEWIGGTFIFSFRPIENSVGSRCPGSILSNGSIVLYLSENGWYACDGLKAYPIGEDKVDNFFFELVDKNYLYKVVGSNHPSEKVVMWLFQSVNASSPDKMLVYSWASNRFSLVDSNVTYIFSGFVQGVNLEQLGALYPNIEDVPLSFDSSVWAGGSRVLQGFDDNGNMVSFNGTNLEALLETGEAQLNAQGRAIIYAVRPVVDTDSVRVSVGHRRKQGLPVTYTQERQQNTVTEECAFNIDNRYHRIKLRIPAGTLWKRIRGLKLRAEATGEI